MYRHCIYCSADLGANDALEGFPVGRSVAFDGERGRLWAVCAHCSRWNLAPIEERWEAVEAAERAFRDTRLRVQRENIGVAKLRDGTRLIRIGSALAGEVAAWRYGGELARRRRRHLARGHVSMAVGGTVAAGAVLLALSPLSGVITGFGAFWGASELYRRVEGWADRLMAARADREPVHRLGHRDSPTHAPIVLLRAHLRGAYLANDEATGELLVRVPALAATEDPLEPAVIPAPVTLRGVRARMLLGRVMVGVNAAGATPRVVEHALDELARAGSADAYLARLAEQHTTLELPRGTAPRPHRWDLYWTRRADMEGIPPAERDAWLSRTVAGRIAGEAYGGLVRGLALEVALHEAEERRALEGELTLLESAWKEAEALASIADGLALPAAPKD